MRYWLCMSKWHEVWNHESMSRWQVGAMYRAGEVICMACEAVRRQMQEEEGEEEEEQEEEEEE